MGWAKGVEPSSAGPQPAALPLSYVHQKFISSHLAFIAVGRRRCVLRSRTSRTSRTSRAIGLVVPPDRFERPARGVEIRCSVQLSYGGRLNAWRRDRESNPALRFCRPPHGRFATAPKNWQIGNGHLSPSGTCPDLAETKTEIKAEAKSKAKQWSRPPELNRPAQLGRLAPNRSARPALKRWWIVFGSNEVFREEARLQRAAVTHAAHDPLGQLCQFCQFCQF